ncbi:MAG: hypothetical protein ABSF36_02060 [Candidatus Methanomethylicaceae archaeon]
MIQYCQRVTVKDFITKAETSTRNKKGKREYLNDLKTKDMMDKLNDYFESMVEIPRIKVGERQTLETLINEEALKLYQPGTYMCPDILLDIISYTFQPISDMASVNAPYPNFNLSMVSSVTASGYWTGGLLGHTEFSNFSSGIYTVAGGDEWGQLILLHFVVI